MCCLGGRGLQISGYEAQPVKAKEKSIPEFQLVKEETESTTSLFDNMETVTLPEAENQTKEAVVLTRDTSESNRTYKDGTYYGKRNRIWRKTEGGSRGSERKDRICYPRGK